MNRDQIVITLLRAGADASLVDGEGKTPAELAKSLKLNALVDVLNNGPPPQEEAAE